MKKILILNGAGKKNGNTAAMIRAFSEAAKENGNEIQNSGCKPWISTAV